MDHQQDPGRAVRPDRDRLVAVTRPGAGISVRDVHEPFLDIPLEPLRHALDQRLGHHREDERDRLADHLADKTELALSSGPWWRRSHRLDVETEVGDSRR